MRIASKIHPAPALAFVLLLSAGIPSAQAADTAPSLPAPAAPALASPPPAASAADNSALVALPPPLPMNTGSGRGGRLGNLAPLEERVTDSVKGAIRQLGAIDNVNFEDLNTARQAVAKLDILIEIEKRMAELEKLHGEHGSEKLAAAIPMSALGAPPLPMPKVSSPSSEMMVAPVGSHSDVSRILGAAGHYSAIVQGKTVRVGDTLPDGSSVVGISAKLVETKSKDGTLHQLKVKGVDEVFGHSL